MNFKDVCEKAQYMSDEELITMRKQVEILAKGLDGELMKRSAAKHDRPESGYGDLVEIRGRLVAGDWWCHAESMVESACIKRLVEPLYDFSLVTMYENSNDRRFKFWAARDVKFRVNKRPTISRDEAESIHKVGNIKVGIVADGSIAMIRED